MIKSLSQTIWNKVSFFSYNLILPLLIPLAFLFSFKIIGTNIYLTQSINQTISVYLFVTFFMNIGTLTDNENKFNKNLKTLDVNFLSNKSKFIASSIILGVLSIVFFNLSYMAESLFIQRFVFLFNLILIFLLLILLDNNPYVQNSKYDDKPDFIEKDDTDDVIERNILGGDKK